MNNMIELFEDSLSQIFVISDLAFPYGDYIPPFSKEVNFVVKVIGSITGDFTSPEVSIGSRHFEILAVLMPMPKAAVNKYDRIVFRENNIRFSRQTFSLVFSVEVVAKAMCM
ncbi:hypothetical protein GCM10023331_39840 [Algivirga pacifica]|uniref:Uncharacterized protein n=1 Tax=Algivirga pacifica TaxID=1162670 RepID=A0ABP9DL12_9BACT